MLNKKKVFRFIRLVMTSFMIIAPTMLCISLMEEKVDSIRDVEALSVKLSNVKPDIKTDEPMPIEEDSGFKHEILDYQKTYEDMYAEPYNLKEHEEGKKVVYLTFDDGPSNLTAEILPILEYYKVKATFFVTGCETEYQKDLLRKIVADGHTIAIHTYSHNYYQVYDSVQSYLDDFAQMYYSIYEITGVKPNLFRFPGGSVNAYNKGIYKEIIAEMLRRNFIYHDWNISAQDAVKGGASKQYVHDIVTQNASRFDKSIVLMHDSATKRTTVDALPYIILTLAGQGYEFDKLDNTVMPFIFGYDE